jgi:hypothetical protein
MFERYGGGEELTILLPLWRGLGEVVSIWREIIWGGKASP